MSKQPFNQKLWNQQLLQILQGIEKINVRDKQFLINNFNYLFFVTLFALFYIFNARYAENKMRRINDLGRKIKEQHWQYTSKQAELMVKSRQKNVTELVRPLGLRNLVLPPQKIVVPSIEAN